MGKGIQPECTFFRGLSSATLLELFEMKYFNARSLARRQRILDTLHVSRKNLTMGVTDL